MRASAWLTAEAASVKQVGSVVAPVKYANRGLDVGQSLHELCFSACAHDFSCVTHRTPLIGAAMLSQAVSLLLWQHDGRQLRRVRQ